jgi:hypothetical protein
VVRGVFWLLLGLWFFFGVGAARQVPAALTLWAFAFGLLVWVWCWRVIPRDRTRRWLRYALIFSDGWLTIRPVALGALRDGKVVVLGLASFQPADLVSVIGPFLVYVALSGAFRIHPSPAAFSSLIAVSAWAYVTVALGCPCRRRSGPAPSSASSASWAPCWLACSAVSRSARASRGSWNASYPRRSRTSWLFRGTPSTSRISGR